MITTTGHAGVGGAVLAKLAGGPMTDAELASVLGSGHQHINQVCRALKQLGRITRPLGPDGRILNTVVPVGQVVSSLLSEDRLKEIIARHLREAGYQVVVKMGKVHGVDLEARRGEERLLIEAKGEAALNAQQVNYFLGALGELLLRMSDLSARYALALPDNKQYRALIGRIPPPVWKALNLSAFLIRADGSVTEVDGPLVSSAAA
ncbi:MAG: hypothetical protein JWM18_2600 [Chloroflexi bacterium]|jgi:hypothetical protein|nr:hypothetical protein [Chloroflexota bacterium]